MATKTLIVLRHAKSDWQTAQADLSRPLSDHGRSDAVAAGRILAGYQIDVVLVSTAVRAAETWTQATAAGARCADVRSSEAIYHAWPAELLDMVHELPESVTTALLIGHQPTLGDLIVSLAKPDPAVDLIRVRFPTSGLAVLTYRGSWRTLSDGKATLKRFEIPRG